MSQSLASLLKARDSLSRSNIIPDQSLNNIENHLFREDQQFISFIEEERELDGTSEMVNVHDSDISIPDSTHTILNKDQSETDSFLRSDIVEVISPSITTEINSINIISLNGKLQSQERENVSLKLNAQKLLDHITSMEQKMTTVIAIESELASTVAQFDIMRSNFTREKEEQKVLTQKLSLELTCLKTTKEEGTTSNLIVEQRCHTLEAEKRDLLRQIESQKFQLAENASAIGSLDRAARHISQLESENKLLRQLNVDLEAADRDKAHIQRRATILENEVTNLKTENLQLQRDLHRKNSTSNESIRYSSPAPPQTPQFRNDQDYYNNRGKDSDIIEVNQGRTNSHQSLNSFTDSSNHPKQQRLAAPSWPSSSSQSLSVPQRNINANSHFVKDSIGDVGPNLYKDSSSSSSSRSLANFIGNRESTLSSGERSETYGSNSTLELTKARSLSTPRNGNDVNNKDSRSSSNPRGHSPSTSTSFSIDPFLVERNKFNSSSKIKGGTSSGGGVSCLYNEDMSDTSNNSAARAPFGTDQSKAIDMTSFDDADNRLTALMTEKSVLYEESARLQQKGGKVLRERTRLQQVDARLIEVGKEIAYERKILTGKPA